MTVDISKTLHLAVITICVDSELADKLIEATEKTPWIVSSSKIDTYMPTMKFSNLRLISADVCLVVIDFDQNLDQASETAKYLMQVLSGQVTIVALAQDENPSTLLAAMRAGCSEFLYKPVQVTALEQMLNRFMQLWVSPLSKNASNGSILTFFGAKGGAGTTTLALHLSMYLVQCRQKRTLLIDLHPELGHVCVNLGLDGTSYHFQELVRNVNRLDRELLRGFVANHSSGLEVLSSPDVSTDRKYIDSESVSKTLNFLKNEYDYIVVDCPTSFDEANIPLFDLSTFIYIVTTQEFSSLRNLSRYIDRFSQTHIQRDKLQVVVNKFLASSVINIEQIEKIIKFSAIRHVSQSNAELNRSTNLGETISPKSKIEFVTQLVKWVENLVDDIKSTPPVHKEKKTSTIWKALLHSNS